MRLIVNADDFGLAPGVNRGIIEAHQKGIVSSATLMANGTAFEEAVSLAHHNPGLGIGCHLVAIGGRPLLDPSAVRLLLGADGRFPRSLRDFLRRHPGCLFSGWRGQEPLAEEFAAQVEKLRRAGLHVSHLDTHKHLHAFPGVREAVFQVARQKGILFVRFPFEPGIRFRALAPAPMTVSDLVSRSGPAPMTVSDLVSRSGPASKRVAWGPWRRRAAVAAMRLLWANEFRRRLAALGLRSADATFGIVHTGSLSPQVIEGFLSQQHEVIEICCHPGYHDSRLVLSGETLRQPRSRYQASYGDRGHLREKEVAILTDPEWRPWLAGRGVQLTNYVALARA